MYPKLRVRRAPAQDAGLHDRGWNVLTYRGDTAVQTEDPQRVWGSRWIGVTSPESALREG